MKINRISESMGLISDEISQRAIESLEKKASVSYYFYNGSGSVELD